MVENLKIALRGFWRGFVDLGRGFDWSYTPQSDADCMVMSLARWFAFILTVASIQCGAYLIAMDKPLGGYTSLVLGMLSAIGAIAAGVLGEMLVATCETIAKARGNPFAQPEG